MTVRLKILSIAVTLLIVFGIVIGISTLLQRQVAVEITGITRYHQPISAAMANFDVITDEYELLPLRLLRQGNPAAADIEAASRREQQLITQMQSDIDTAEATSTKAVEDAGLPVADRIVFARLQTLMGQLKPELPLFVDAGKQVMQAIGDGRLDDARRLSLGFRQYEATFGSDTAAVRSAVIDLTRGATEAVQRKQREIEYLGYVLFAIAAGLGIGIGIAVASGVIHTLRRLVDAAKAVEAGELSVVVPVHTRDEIGELARAFNTMVAELRAKEHIKDTFGKFVDPRIVSGLIGTDDSNLLRADRRVVTVFFSDIRGFTSISEQLTAAAMVNLLNHYFDAVTGCIRADNGILDKYIGDAVMAFWTPPFSNGDSHAAAACRAALAQQQAIAALQSELPNITGLRRNAPSLFVRMGIATGEAVVGTIGSPQSRSFTVIGDTVNLASRLEAINKVYGTRTIVAEETLRLAQSEIEARELDLITVAGKTEPVRIYELLADFGGLSPAESELREAFAAGLAAYRVRDWEGAERQFAACLRLDSGDGPSALFVERIQELRAEPPSPDWDGVWRFAHK